MKNIILIGMPGSGKSTVGAILSKRLQLSFVDTDAMVVKAAGRAIADIFAQDGEEAFRDLESEAARQAGAMEGAVIATGGGIIKRPENMRALSQNGIVFFLDRPPEEIAGDDHSARPLIGEDREKVFRLYRERIRLYRKYGQHRVTNVANASAAASVILRIYKRKEGLT